MARRSVTTITGKIMNTAKIYKDSNGNECSIHWMVKYEPEWAANRIQEGEKAIGELNKQRKAVKEFSKDMERKLKENDHKKQGWLGCSYSYLFKCIRKEVNELLFEMSTDGDLDLPRRIITDEKKQNIINECADIANFAMMISDNIKKEPKK